MDFFGIDRMVRDMKEQDKKREELREMAFQVVGDSQKFLKKIGVISEKEYWEWRLPFDLKHYSVPIK